MMVFKEGRNSPTLRLSPILDPKYFDFPEGSEFRQDHESLTGTPFGSSDSDCSPDPHDGRLFTVSEISYTGKSNALGLEFTYETVMSSSQAIATSISQVESLRSPSHHQDARSRDRPNQEHCVQQEHLVPQPDSTADETLAGGVPQDIRLEADVSDASGLEGMQGLDGYRQRAEEATTAGLSMHSVIAQPHNSGLLRAPQMHPVPLPDGGEDRGHLLYDGLDLGGWLHITLDGVPGTIALSSLDVTLSVPFLMDN